MDAETKKAKLRPQRRKRRVTERREAIVVKVREGTYADILRQIRTDSNLTDFGNNVRRIRRAFTNEMILKLKYGAGKAGEVRGDMAVHSVEQ